MNKHTKGAIAAGAALLLLLGGAGTLSYWSDESSLAEGQISTGSLALGEAEWASGWVYAEGNARAGEAVTTIVPGDSIQRVATVTVDISGDNIQAQLSTPASVDVTVAGDSQPTTLSMPVTATYLLDGEAAPATLTSANDGDVIQATIVVNFPFGSDAVNGNDTQNLVATLDGLTVGVTQIES